MDNESHGQEGHITGEPNKPGKPGVPPGIVPAQHPGIGKKDLDHHPCRRVDAGQQYPVSKAWKYMYCTITRRGITYHLFIA
jgi:hypothetical protein